MLGVGHTLWAFECLIRGNAVAAVGERPNKWFTLLWRLFNSIHLNTPSSHLCAWNLDFDISWIPYICVQCQNQYSKLAHGWDAINVLFCFCAISSHFLFQKHQNSPNKQFQQKIPLPFQPNAPKEGKKVKGVAKTSETLFRIMKLQRGHHSRVNFNILTMYSKG